MLFVPQQVLDQLEIRLVVIKQIQASINQSNGWAKKWDKMSVSGIAHVLEMPQ